MERRMTDGVLGQESWLIEEGIKSQELQWHKLKRKLKKNRKQRQQILLIFRF